jgi:Cu-Zn family superoxide dismutase
VITITSHAVAVLAPNDNGVEGVIRFIQDGKDLHIDYDITGMTDGEHGFHIHTYGDLTDGCSSACAHFNPDNTEHGGLDCKIRHLGDLGNILSEKGVSKGRLSTDTLSLDMGKRNCIIGRMIIVHADPDDLGKGGLNQEGEVIDEAVHEESLKTGNAGKRIACGVIGLAKSEEKCAEGVSMSSILIGAGVGATVGFILSEWS